MKIKSKFIILVVLVGLLSTVLMGCGSDKGNDGSKGLYKPGTYNGEGQGIGGAVKVSVTVDEDKITKVEVTENNETPDIATDALEQIPAAIVEGQTLKVEAVAGASVTSGAILEAVEAALVEAGADVKSLK